MSKLNAFLQEVHVYSLLLGFLLLLTGLITRKFPPRKINLLYGYRTGRSMKNQQNWDFAQKFASQEILRGSSFLFVFSLCGILYPISTIAETVTGTILLTIIFITLFIRTEASLKNFERSINEN